MPVTHAKTNNIADFTQAELDAQIALGNYAPGTALADIVLPSDWNDAHTVSVSMSEINATGTPSSSTFLRGDGVWSAPAVSGDWTGTFDGQEGSWYLDRANHTGEQAISTVTGLQTALDGKQATGNYITALTGDVTASGPGSVAATLATVNSNVGTFGGALFSPSLTVDGKGRITAISNTVPTPAAANLTGTTLASSIVNSSLTGVGTLTSGSTGAGFTLALGTSTLTGDLPFANLAQLTANSIAANATGSTADVAALAIGANTFPARSSTGNLAAKSITDFGLSLIDDVAASDARTTLGLGTMATEAATDYFLRQPAANWVINDSGGDFDGRIEGDTDPNLFCIDAGNDNIGIGISNPIQKFEVATEVTARRGIAVAYFFDDTQAGNVNIRKARGTIASPTSLSSGDTLGGFGMQGYGSTAGTGGFKNGAFIRTIAAENFTNTAAGSYMRFDATPIGSTTVQEVFRFKSTGVGIGSIDPQYLLHVYGVDNSTVQAVEIAATSANVTAADTFIDFRSSSGSIGSIAGTAASGVIAYNTFTGSHWSQSNEIQKTRHSKIRKRKINKSVPVFDEDRLAWILHDYVDEEDEEVFYYTSEVEPGTVLVSTEDFCSWANEDNDYLPKCAICQEADSTKVYGVYGGHDIDGDIIVLGLGAGKIRVCNEGGPIEIGDFLSSASLPGYAKRYDGNDMRRVIAKARQNFSGETATIACTYLCG